MSEDRVWVVPTWQMKSSTPLDRRYECGSSEKALRSFSEDSAARRALRSLVMFTSRLAQASSSTLIIPFLPSMDLYDPSNRLVIFQLNLKYDYIIPQV